MRCALPSLRSIGIGVATRVSLPIAVLIVMAGRITRIRGCIKAGPVTVAVIGRSVKAKAEAKADSSAIVAASAVVATATVIPASSATIIGAATARVGMAATRICMTA